MKVLLLCGNAANQRALACRLSLIIPLSAVAVISHSAPHPDSTLRRAMRGVIGYPLWSAWRSLMEYYGSIYPGLPEIPQSFHHGVNAESVRNLVEELKPDLVLVSGTDLVKRPLIKSIKRLGHAINLHTGISPYIKGGPNCTNLALAMGRPDLIGNTVMWLDLGVDSGNIIATERTPLTGDESLTELHLKVMDHAHDLYSRVAMLLVSGMGVPSVQQASIGSGRLFLSRDWNAGSAFKAVLGYYCGFNHDSVHAISNEVLIPLSSSSVKPSA